MYWLKFGFIIVKGEVFVFFLIVRGDIRFRLLGLG